MQSDKNYNCAVMFSGARKLFLAMYDWMKIQMLIKHDRTRDLSYLHLRFFNIFLYIWKIFIFPLRRPLKKIQNWKLLLLWIFIFHYRSSFFYLRDI